MNTTSSNTTFTPNSTAPTADKTVDPKRATVRISVEEFEELIQYRKICQDLMAEFKEELL